MCDKYNKNDDALFEELCIKYYEQIYSFCNRLVNGQKQYIDFVEDCTQNTFLEAQKHFIKLKTHPNIEGWLYTTARNLINNTYRSHYLKKKHEIFWGEEITATSLDDLAKEIDEPLNGSYDPDKLCSEILSKLYKNEYNLYIDYYKTKLSITELSKKYDISASAVTSRIYRLKKKIKKFAHDYFKE